MKRKNKRTRFSKVLLTASLRNYQLKPGTYRIASTFNKKYIGSFEVNADNTIYFYGIGMEILDESHRYLKEGGEFNYVNAKTT